MADLAYCIKCKEHKPSSEFWTDKYRSSGYQSMCKNCKIKYYKEPQYRRNSQTFTISNRRFGWSKWGGGNMGAMKEVITDEWTCQICSTKQTSELPAYLFELLPREFIRICSVCENTAFFQNINEIETLIKIRRMF